MRILVTGAGGMLGREVTLQLRERGHDAVPCDRHRLDVTDARHAHAIIVNVRPEAVIHCAAFTNVDAAEAEPDLAHRVNVDGTGNVARAAREAGARLLYVSTDYVFDGLTDRPYLPDSPARPIGVYGRSKLEGEHAAELAGDKLIARTSWVYGRGGSNFGSRALDLARAGKPLRAIADQRSVPTWVRDTAAIMIRLLEHKVPAGIYHACNRGAATWYEWLSFAAEAAGVRAKIDPVALADLALPAPRPLYSVMNVEVTEALTGPVRDWRDAVAAAIGAGL